MGSFLEVGGEGLLAGGGEHGPAGAAADDLELDLTGFFLVVSVRNTMYWLAP